MSFHRFVGAATLLLTFSSLASSQDILEGRGHVQVRGEITSGILKVNFTNNSVIVDLESHNLMFFHDIELIELEESEETILVYDNTFYRLVTDGTRPLLQRENAFFSIHKNEVVEITANEKEVYSLFGKEKKTIKNYAFLRDLKFDEPADVLAIFEYYNSID